MTANFNHDDCMDVLLVFDRELERLVFRIKAKRPIRITEVQGFSSDVEAFGLSLPAGFRRMQFGEGVEVPEGMKSDLAHMNRLNFRWGCDVQVRPGVETEIALPASGQGKDMACLTLAYEYRRLFGLLKRKRGIYARLSPPEAG